jgi:hypothetical protein
MAVQRVIGGVEIEDDLLGRRRVRFEEQVDEQAFDRRAVVADLVVARRLGGRVLETVQGALAGERRAVRAPGGELAGERRQNRVAWPPGWGTGPQPRSGGQAGEVGEAAHRAGLGQALGFSASELVGDGADQALIARQTKDVVDTIRTPRRTAFVR